MKYESLTVIASLATKAVQRPGNEAITVIYVQYEMASAKFYRAQHGKGVSGYTVELRIVLKLFHEVLSS